MKKIIIVSFITFTGCLTLSAQQSLTPMPAPNGQKVKVMTTQEANALNGTANPTINGKPYSQYKTEQEALKNKQQSAAISSATPALKPVTITVDAPTTTPTIKPEQSAQPAEKPKGN